MGSSSKPYAQPIVSPSKADGLRERHEMVTHRPAISGELVAIKTFLRSMIGKL